MKQKGEIISNHGYVKAATPTNLKRFHYKDLIGKEQKQILAERIRTLTGKIYSPENIKSLKYSQFLWAMRKIGEEHSIPVARWCCYRWNQ